MTKQKPNKLPQICYILSLFSDDERKAVRARPSQAGIPAASEMQTEVTQKPKSSSELLETWVTETVDFYVSERADHYHDKVR